MVTWQPTNLVLSGLILFNKLATQVMEGRTDLQGSVLEMLMHLKVIAFYLGFPLE